MNVLADQNKRQPLALRAHHIAQRTNLVVVAKSPIERIVAYARGRGWRNLRLLSSAGNSYNRDYHGEDDRGAQWPMLNVFRKSGGKVRHFWGSELLWEPPESPCYPYAQGNAALVLLERGHARTAAGDSGRQTKLLA